MEKYRNLDYLEHESAKHRKNEDERKEEQDKRLKKMRERLLKDEVDLLRGGRAGDGEEDDVRGRVAKNGMLNPRNSGFVHHIFYCAHISNIGCTFVSNLIIRHSVGFFHENPHYIMFKDSFYTLLRDHVVSVPVTQSVSH